MNRAARRFLNTGRIGRSNPAELAVACGRLILLESQRSIDKALPIARKLVKHSRPLGHPMLSTALRALGWVYLEGGHYREAAKCYLQARELLLRDPLARARVDRTLIDVYMHLGDMTEARRRAQLAMDTFRRLDSDIDTAKTRINYANLFHHQDKHRDACRQYRKAAEVLVHAGDDLALAFCEYNLANVLVQLFDLDEAEKLYSQAEKRFKKNKYNLYAVECQYGLAWLRMLQGSFHQALLDLTACEKAFSAAGRTTWAMLCRLDRAETYLSLNLFSDACGAAKAAEQFYHRRGMRYETAKAAFFRAKAEYALGNTRDAAKSLGRAKTSFQAEGNTGFLAAVELTTALIAGPEKIDTRTLARSRRRFSQAQLPLWQAICDLHLLAIEPGDKSINQRLRQNPAIAAVPHLYARWQTLLGDRLMNSGRLVQAREHWATAADTLDAIRAKLPPLELRSAFMIGRSDPYLRLTHSLEASDTAEAAAWSERHRTSGLWSAPDDLDSDDSNRHKVERGLADLAQRVSALSSRIADKSQLRLTETSVSQPTLARLQKQVRLDICGLRATVSHPDYDISKVCADFKEVSRRQPVVQFHSDGPDLLAFVHEDGLVRSHRFADGQRLLRKHLGFWHVLMSRSLENPESAAPENIAEEQRLFDRFGDWLWTPLEISHSIDKILIMPEGRTSNLPWSTLRIGGEYLGDRHSFIISPSLRHHLHASEITVDDLRTEIFVGQADGLSHCRSEIEDLLDRKELEAVMHDPCRRDDWPNKSRAGIWHYTGHAELRADNPFYSSLRMEDGPMFAADFRLKKNLVKLVVLAACRTGQQTYLPGEESSGLMRSLLEMGARNVVASHWAVADEATALWMSTFYRAYLINHDLHISIRTATLTVREKYPSAYHWAAFSLFGAGEANLSQTVNPLNIIRRQIG